MFKEPHTKKIIEKVLLAINYIHQKDLVHRDLKLENILYSDKNDDSEIKVIDFGLANKFNKTNQMKSLCGTPIYMSPEMLKGKYDKKCDI